MSPRLRAAVLLLAAIAAVGLTARLGVWQLDRAAQKLQLQADIEGRAELPALENAVLAASDTAAGEQLHRRVRLRGHWLADRTVFLDNRPMEGRVGFFVVTPLQLEGRAEAILVQRGWLPRDNQDRTRLPELPTPAGTVELAGRLTAAPSRLYEFAPSAGGVIRQNLDGASFALETKLTLLPLTVLQLAPAGEGAAVDGLSRHWAAPDLGLQKHYGYAFQWFALAALFLGLYVWFQIVRPRRIRARFDAE